MTHITNRDTCSSYQFTKEILRLAGLETPVVPITSDQFPQEARRPSFSVLDNYHLRLLGMDDMKPWQEALKDYMIMGSALHAMPYALHASYDLGLQDLTSLVGRIISRLWTNEETIENILK